MNTFIEAYDTLFEGFTEVLNEMVEEEKIKHLSIMGVSVGTPEFPFLNMWVNKPFEIVEDTGLSETFEGELILSSQVLNNNNPNDGIHEATSIVSEAHNRIVKSRYLEEELGIFYVKTKDFGWIPYGYGKQENVYCAGVTFKIRLKIKNPKCRGE